MITRYFILIICGFLLASCSSQKTHYYTLHHTPKPPAAHGAYPFTLGVGPVFLPESHNQPGVVSLTEGQEVVVSQFNIWAGYLNQSVTRVLADNLSILLGADTVWPFPWDNRMRPARQVRVVIEEMAGQRGKFVAVQAKFTITADNGERLVAAERRRIEVPCTADTYEAYVAALNQALNQLSEQMALTLSAKQ
ncbi:MAG: hypothetical protein RL497_498 [Pseudomonadota bacterium]|jgi:uncharacterized lipoprotein YmbA